MYNEKYMILALKEAKKAYRMNEVPVGAVIVKNGAVIAKAHNSLKKEYSVLNHAELRAISFASNVLKDWRLTDCELYVTLEPCPMCAGAILNSRIKKIFIGAPSNIKSNKYIIEKILNNEEYYHKVEIEYVKNDASSNILTNFFNDIRNN